MGAPIEEDLGWNEAETVASGSYVSSREVCAFPIGGNAIDCSAVDYQFNFNRRDVTGTKGPASSILLVPTYRASHQPIAVPH